MGVGVGGGGVWEWAGGGGAQVYEWAGVWGPGYRRGRVLGGGGGVTRTTTMV